MLQALDWSHSSSYAAALAFGYLLGSIPFGLILTRLAGTQDIRSIGSGNIGATNVLRTGRKGLAAATLLCDMLKGTLAVARRRGISTATSLRCSRPVGRVFRTPLSGVARSFKGGKGVATYIGVLLGLAWPAGIAMCLIWLAIAAAHPLFLARRAGGELRSRPACCWRSATGRRRCCSRSSRAMLWIMHRANIARLIAGTEGRIGERSAAGA